MATNPMVQRMAWVAPALLLAACEGAAGRDGLPGAQGRAGASSLTKVSVEPAGANCETGGAKIETGADTDGDGVLDASEVVTSATAYVCNGGPGAGGKGALVKTTSEPPGSNCIAGGVKVEVGVDVDGDGVLGASEVDAAATTFVCNGAVGAGGRGALVRTANEPVGTHCAAGGVKVEVGIDADADGVLEADEVSEASTTYVCNGADGGRAALVKTTAEPTGSRCPNGGVRIESGVDSNGDGELEDDEIDAARTVTVCNGAAAGPGGSVAPSTGLHVVVESVSTSPAEPVRVRFRLEDDRGFPVDVAGRYSVNQPIRPRFSLAWFATDSSGHVTPLTTYTRSGATPQPAAYSPSRAGDGTLVENGSGAGDYTYTFPTTTTPGGAVAVAYDPARLGATHVVWIEATRQIDLVYPDHADTFFASNVPHYFVPDGSGAPLSRDLVTSGACNRCHGGFAPEGRLSSAFHGGARVEAAYCAVCHNPARASNPAADAAVFVHRIHAGAQVQDRNRFHGLAATYPQDVRRCDACHGGAAQGAQAFAKPAKASCGSCHDGVDFTGTLTNTCVHPPALGADGVPIPCRHLGGPQADDSKCASCHPASAVAANHRAVARPDPANAWARPGGSPNTNASFVAAAGEVPPGAAVITYEVKSVDAVPDAAIAPFLRPQITFKLRKNGSDVVFQQYSAGVTTELMPGFVGSPSVYFAFAVPQDGNRTPADFNASVNGYIRNIWDGTAVGTGAGTMTGPDATGHYTIRLTGVRIPPVATMLTGGIGYSYSLASAPPLVQVDLPDFPYDTDGKKQGGLSVPAPNVWKVATGYAGRRPIVDNARCLDCHGALGVSPSFHAGQRNDGPTCSFCHTQNRTSSGWSASSRVFVHAVHAGRRRVTPFTWHATEPGPGYGEIDFPAPLDDCTACHLPNTFDYTARASFEAAPNLPLTTVATGRYNRDPTTNPSFFTISPYVVADDVTDYGSGFSFNGGTGAVTEAADTTLVISELTAACSGCHDSAIALDHMKGSGGLFYARRSEALDPAGPKEQCLICHGPGRIAAIGAVHRQ